MRQATKLSLRAYTSEERRRIRSALLKKYGPYCQLCLVWGRSKRTAVIDVLSQREPRSLSIDHIIPTSCGGDNKPSNMWPTHAACNHARGDRPLTEVVHVSFRAQRPQNLRLAYSSTSPGY